MNVDVSVEMAQVQMAFTMRQPDALERASRLRDRLVSEAKRFLKAAELQGAVIESGRDEHDLWLAGEIVGKVDVVGAAAANLARANDLAGAASNVSDLIEQFEGKHLRDGIADPGPTTEMLYQVAHSRGGDPILRLRALKKIDDDHVRAARDIEALVRHVTVGIGMKVQRLPTASGISPETVVTGGLSEMERGALMATIHAKVYIPWTKQNAVRPHVAMLLRLIMDGVSLRIVAREAGMRWATACGHVSRCLARYAKARSRFNRDQRASEGIVSRS